VTDTLIHPAAPATLAGEERAALVDPIRRLLTDRCTEADVRRIMEDESGHDPALWQALVDLGLTGLMVPEAQGGAGLSAIELELAMEEAGAALLPAPLLSGAVAAALLADDPARLAQLAAGRIAAVAFAGGYDWTGQGAVMLRDGHIAGTLRFVPDAAIADTLLIAHDDGAFVVERAEAIVSPLPVFDRTRRLADVTVDAPARQVADGAAVARARDVAIVGLAGEQAGAARRLLDITVDYARTRHQFGRAIGSFQAIKHMAADLLLESESALSAARDAARQLAQDTPEKDAAIALAAFACADAFVCVARDAVQMHGGIAFTWAHPAHLYLRRARSAAQLHGDAAFWRERYIRALEAV
jgi:alkylation response protein AidB-like acyl-CoA dehydrogenase